LSACATLLTSAPTLKKLTCNGGISPLAASSSAPSVGVVPG
jgi:hypothetical protein